MWGFPSSLCTREAESIPPRCFQTPPFIMVSAGGSGENDSWHRSHTPSRQKLTWKRAAPERLQSFSGRCPRGSAYDRTTHPSLFASRSHQTPMRPGIGASCACCVSVFCVCFSSKALENRDAASPCCRVCFGFVFPAVVVKRPSHTLTQKSCIV